MYIKKLFIFNYKSCKNCLIDFLKDEPTILIGINDSGKSTILKSLDLLLDGKTTYNFRKEDKIKNDLSNTPLPNEEFNKILEENSLPKFEYNTKQTIILGEFKVEDADLIINETLKISSHLEWVLENIDKKIDHYIY